MPQFDYQKLAKEELFALVGLHEGKLFLDKKKRPIDLPEFVAPIADNHSHLSMLEHPAAALVRAELAGLGRIIVPLDPIADNELLAKITPDEWLDTLIDEALSLRSALAQHMAFPDYASQLKDSLYQGLSYVAGVHPYGAQQLVENKVYQEKLSLWLEGKRCVGVGEFGFDFGPYNELDADIQTKAFDFHYQLAKKHALPMQLHIRNKDTDLEDTLDSSAHDLAFSRFEQGGWHMQAIDLHCFTEDLLQSERFAQKGCYISYGGASTFKRNVHIRESLKALPQEQILIETDAPYMAPVPLRGKKCEPAMTVFSQAQLYDSYLDFQPAAAKSNFYLQLFENSFRCFPLK